MGLDCSHGAFHGAYSAFNRLRQVVCKAMNGSFPPHNNVTLDHEMFYWEGSKDTHLGLYEFLCHSDCDGEILPEKGKLIAEELEGLLPVIEQLDDEGGWHIASAGGYIAVTKRFIGGCRAAHEQGEALIFS